MSPTEPIVVYDQSPSDEEYRDSTEKSHSKLAREEGVEGLEPSHVHRGSDDPNGQFPDRERDEKQQFLIGE